MSGHLKTINNNSEVANRDQALAINMSAAKSIQGLMRTNLGPKGTLKILVGGAGDLRLTKDGNVLLHDMQIQHPTALMIARTATAQDDMTGDGTTSIVLFVGELLQQAAKYIAEGTHPSILIEGLYLAKTEAMKFLKTIGDQYKEKIPYSKEMLTQVAKTSLRTKLREELADRMASIVVDSVERIKQKDEKKPALYNIDLHMVEIMHMKNKLDMETTFIDGLVMDHGARHPGMRTSLQDVAILACNVSLEYEKTEVHSGFYVSTAEEKQKVVEAERKVVDDKVRKIVELKKKVCDPDNPNAPKDFLVVNEKGIDPLSLDMLAKAGITALRRAKRRNMERLTLACGCSAVNSVEDLSADVCGWAEKVTEQTLGDDKFTFVEGTKQGKSCTILIRGPNLHTIAQIKDAVRDGLRAVKNVYDDGMLAVPGAAAVEIALSEHLTEYSKEVKGRKQLGVKCFAEALLIIPKILAQNSGLDPQDSIIKLSQEYQTLNHFEKQDDEKNIYTLVGLDLDSGEPMDPVQEGVLDNFKVKQQILEASTFTATQLLYVDEILKAGKQRKAAVEDPEAQDGAE